MSVNHCRCKVFSHFSVWLCVAFFIFFEVGKFLKTIFVCGWTDTLFAKLWLEGWLEPFGNVCGCMRWLVLSF